MSLHHRLHSLPTEILERIFLNIGNITVLSNLSETHPRFLAVLRSLEFWHVWCQAWCLDESNNNKEIEFLSQSFFWNCDTFKCIPQADTFTYREQPDLPAYTECAIKAYQTNNRQVNNILQRYSNIYLCV